MILDCPMLLKDKVHSSEVDKILKSFKFTDSHKVQYLKSFVDGLSEKIIIFSTHPNTLNNLSGLLKKHNPIIIHGELGQSQEERHELVNRFNDKASDNKIFLLSTSVGGVGLNLNKDCRREIFFDLPYDATLGKQAMNRTDRINSLEDSIIDILLYTQSIDMIRYEKVVNRLKLNDSFLNKKLTKEELKKILLGINS